MLLIVCFPIVVSAAPTVDVEVEGLEGEYLDNVLFYLDIEKRKDDENFNVAWLKRLHAQAPEQIRTALEPFGYYNPDINASLTEKDGKWLATYEVDLGSPVTLSSVDVSLTGPGADEPVIQQAVTSFPLKVGDRLDHKLYEEGRSAIIDAATGYGYVKIKPEKAQVRVDIENNQAQIELTLDTDARYYFGDVRMHQDFLADDLVEDFITIEPGAPYLNEDLLRFQQGFTASGYASSAKIEPSFEEAVDDHVPLDVTLVPSKRHRIVLGGGWDTDQGPRISGRWTNRRVNRYGHHSEVLFKFGTTQRELKGSYYIPVLNKLTDRFATSAKYEYEETASTERNTTEGELAFVRRNLEDTYLVKLFLQFFHETYKAGLQPETTSNLLPIAGGTLRFSYLEESLFPRHGHNLYGDLRGATSAILSDTSFLRLLLRGEYFYPLGSKGRLNLRSELGTSLVEDFLLYPVSLRFFAGGASSVRGFGYKDLGPKDSAGNVVGGKHLVTASVEYDYRFLEKWAAALFVDAGNAFDDFEDLRVGSGFGIRWLAPFGSLRVDAAWPVDEPFELGDVQIYIGFGAVL